MSKSSDWSYNGICTSLIVPLCSVLTSPCPKKFCLSAFPCSIVKRISNSLNLIRSKDSCSARILLDSCSARILLDSRSSEIRLASNQLKISFPPVPVSWLPVQLRVFLLLVQSRVFWLLVQSRVFWLLVQPQVSWFPFRPLQLSFARPWLLLVCLLQTSSVHHPQDLSRSQL